MMSKLNEAAINAIIEADESGGYATSTVFQGWLAIALEQKREERFRAIQEQMDRQGAEERDGCKVRCPQCGSRLVLEADYDY